MVNGGAAFFPIITAGKYDDNYQMPVNITIAHAVADGYHIGLFFEYLQEEILQENQYHEIVGSSPAILQIIEKIKVCYIFLLYLLEFLKNFYCF